MKDHVKSEYIGKHCYFLISLHAPSYPGSRGFGLRSNMCRPARSISLYARKNLLYSGYFQAAITCTTTQCGDKARDTFSRLNGLSVLRDVN